uniref:3'-5' exonuclease n=1 Tax=Pithovirus LCDPAC01 TaxID=2506600 RepID=A0A481YPL6_9VIRU|nr:MAG: 3'-5' exonuclease [Pithovirus LCDPAC01]
MEFTIDNKGNGEVTLSAPCIDKMWIKCKRKNKSEAREALVKFLLLYLSEVPSCTLKNNLNWNTLLSKSYLLPGVFDFSVLLKEGKRQIIVRWKHLFFENQTLTMEVEYNEYKNTTVAEKRLLRKQMYLSLKNKNKVPTKDMVCKKIQKKISPVILRDLGVITYTKDFKMAQQWFDDHYHKGTVLGVDIECVPGGPVLFQFAHSKTNDTLLLHSVKVFSLFPESLRTSMEQYDGYVGFSIDSVDVPSMKIVAPKISLIECRNSKLLVLGLSHNISLYFMAQIFIIGSGKYIEEINKKEMQLCNWKDDLTKRQKLYAALDAIFSIKLYEALNKL